MMARRPKAAPVHGEKIEGVRYEDGTVQIGEQRAMQPAQIAFYRTFAGVVTLGPGQAVMQVNVFSYDGAAMEQVFFVPDIQMPNDERRLLGTHTSKLESHGPHQVDFIGYGADPARPVEVDCMQPDHSMLELPNNPEIISALKAMGILSPEFEAMLEAQEKAERKH